MAVLCENIASVNFTIYQFSFPFSFFNCFDEVKIHSSLAFDLFLEMCYKNSGFENFSEKFQKSLTQLHLRSIKCSKGALPHFGKQKKEQTVICSFECIQLFAHHYLGDNIQDLLVTAATSSGAACDLLNVLKCLKNVAKGALAVKGIGYICIAYLFAVANKIVFFHGAVLLLFLAEGILAHSAKGALEILGQILELCSGSYSVFGIAELLIIYPSANVAYVFFHFNFSLILFILSKFIKVQERGLCILSPPAPG